MATPLTIGSFTLDGGSLTGPRVYFEDRGGSQAAVDKALKSAVFAVGLTESPTPEHALLVALQTDYAAWKGEREMELRLAQPLRPISVENLNLSEAW